MSGIINDLTSYIKAQQKSISVPYKFILHVLLNKQNEIKKKRSELIKEQIRKIEPSVFDRSSFGYELDTEITEFSKLSKNDFDYLNYRIESIQIKNFRGFGPFIDTKNDKGILFNFYDEKKHIFKKIIIYGPNGSGKSSFCEAIEYKLTGQIKECRRRNIKINDYIACGKLKPDINIVIRDKQDHEVPFDCIPLEIREKCFIEHNRIQAFALFDSKQTGDKQKDILASLIGLENLQDFIDSFVKPNSFKLEKSTKYEKDYESAQGKKSEIEIEIRTLEESLKIEVYDELSKILKQGDKKACYLYSYKMQELNKEIKKAEFELARLQKQVDFINKEEYISLIAKTNQIYQKYKQMMEDYNKQREKISFKNLYQAVISLKENISNEKCPLCETDISKTAVNPFTKAEKEMKSLEGIIKMEKEIEELKFSLFGSSYYERLKEFNFKMLKSIKDMEWQFETIPFTDSMLSGNDKLMNLERFFEVYYKNELFIIEYFEKSNKEKVTQDSRRKEYEKKKNVIDSLKKQRTIIDNIWRTKEKREDDIKKKYQELRDIEKNIGEQKARSENEIKYNEFLEQVEASYQAFYSDLTSFKKKIERDTIENTEADIVHYYKFINKGDSDCEQIEGLEIVIPEKESDKYEILLKKNNEDISATQYLSEGHLRALGLSVILALAKKSNVPFLVFDDVVNAIDLEHRANLIELLFNDKYLKKKQFIVTTHDRLFWERFCNEYNPKRNRNLISFNIKYQKWGIVCDKYSIGYLQRIELAIDNYDIRQALNYCRIWFETIVINYCVKHKKEITGIFKEKTKDNLLSVSLNKIYSVFEADSNIKNNSDYKKLKKDPMIWKLLNQEHHAFSEYNLNAIHAKTSDEIREIYEALKGFCNFLENYKSKTVQPTKVTKKKSGVDNNQPGLFIVKD